MSQGIENPDLATHGQQVLVLQGGGALGAYQVGVYQALDQFGIDLDWVVGTSIGAIAGQACGVVKFAKRSFSHAFSCSSDLIVRWSKSTSGGSFGGNG